MTATQARELRRARKRRVLRLLSDDGTGAPRLAFTHAERQEIRRAMRTWGAVTLPFAWSELRQRP
ncbi:MAG: hypothetical protein ABIM89_18355 [Mycobacteriales bacterium]